MPATETPTPPPSTADLIDAMSSHLACDLARLERLTAWYQEAEGGLCEDEDDLRLPMPGKVEAVGFGIHIAAWFEEMETPKDLAHALEYWRENFLRVMEEFGLVQAPAQE